MNGNRRSCLVAAVAAVALSLAACSAEGDQPAGNASGGDSDASSSSSSAGACTPAGVEPGSAEPSGERLPDGTPVANENGTAEVKFGETVRIDDGSSTVDITVQAPTPTTGNPEFPLADGETVCMIAMHAVVVEDRGTGEWTIDAKQFDAYTEAGESSGESLGVATVDNNMEEQDVKVGETATGFVSFTVHGGDVLASVELAGGDEPLVRWGR